MRLVALAVCVWLLAAAPASAHSLVERSSPAANSALDAAPRQVELWFNEPVDPSFSTATVVDPSGTRVSERAVVTGDGRKMTVPLRDLARGFYTVRWRVLSSVDGHTTSGAYAFTVGLGARPPEQGGGAAGPDAGLAAVRWIAFLATVLASGATLFPMLILRPALRRGDAAGGIHLTQPARSVLRVVTVAAACAVIATAALEIVVRAVLLTDAPPAVVAASGQLSRMVWGTKPGWSALIRVSMAALLLLPQTVWGRILRGAGFFWCALLSVIFALLGGPAALAGSAHLALVVLVGTVYGLVSLMAAIILPQIRDLRIPEFAMVPPAIGGAILFGLTVNSHAWGSGALAVLFDWAHLLAVAVWIGGLGCLVSVLVATPADARASLARGLVPRFSRAAAVSLAVLVVTGIYSTWLHVPSLRALTATVYGRFLGAKLLLLVPLVALGAINRFKVRPALDAGSGSQEQRLLRLTGTEVGIGIVVLLVVALLTASPPARTTLAMTPTAPAALRYAAMADGVRFALSIDPAQPGPNRVDATVSSDDGRPLPADMRVLARVTKLDEDLAPVTQDLAASGPDRYTASLTLPFGWWKIDIAVRRRGRVDAVATFPLRLGQGPPAMTDPAASRRLEAARAAMSALRAWREQEHITDGLGGVLVAEAELVRPDRMRVRTTGGAEVVFVGSTRYLREGPAAWKVERLTKPPAVEGVLQYLKGAESVVAGRPASCEGEPCRVLLWEAPGRAAAFAAWIGEQTQRIHQIMMVAPQHYMTGGIGDFDAAIRIDAPR